MRVTAGICAFNEAHRIGSCLQSLVSQRIPEGFDLTEILVVASGCTDGTERTVEEWSGRDSRIVLVRQPERIGKASALNEILDRAKGELIVILNADASLQDDSLAALLRPFATDATVVVACGAPSVDPSGVGVEQIVANFHWELHNRTLDALSRRRLPNHCCDEFMALRRGFLLKLPPDLVNDGAYFGTVASSRGVSVRFCSEARVSVEIPRSLHGFLEQRRRILRGHDQIVDLLQRPSNTLENLFRKEPVLAFAIAAQQILSRPGAFLAFVLVVLPLEVLANVLATRDRIVGLRHDPAWRPVE